jgi:hypothetical protein
MLNVFYLDHNPLKAAGWLCDQHVTLMQLETAQMLCTAVRMRMGLVDAPREQLPGELKFLYKTAHPKHGCTIWVGESWPNFKWAYRHSIGMSSQQRLRFGTQHKSYRVAKLAFRFALGLRLEGRCLFPRQDKVTPPYLEFGPELGHLKDPSDPVGSYRKFYVADKAKFATWTNSEPPPWWPKDINEK